MGNAKNPGGDAVRRTKVGDPFPDGKGYVDEDGGRESGPAYAGFVLDGGNRASKGAQPVHEPRESRSAGPSASAANPAACPMCVERIMPRLHARNLHARIRDLEGQVAELTRSRASILREHNALAEAIAEGTRMRDLVARAEKAEARNAGLEERLLAIGKAYASADMRLRQVADLLYAKEAGA